MRPLVLIPSRAEAHLLSAALDAECPRAVIGIGPVAAALGAVRALAEHPDRPCLLVGLAGSRDLERAPLGAVRLGSEVVNEAVGAGDAERFLALGEMGIDEPLPPDRLALERPPGLADVPAVAIGTVATASGDGEHAAARRRRHPDVLLEEMEGHAVALACREVDRPLAVLRAVSNRCGDRDVSGWAFGPACEALSAALAALAAGDGW